MERGVRRMMKMGQKLSGEPVLSSATCEEEDGNAAMKVVTELGEGPRRERAGTRVEEGGFGKELMKIDNSGGYTSTSEP